MPHPDDAPTSATTRPRLVRTRAFPTNRRFVTAAMRAGRHASAMHGLVSVDVTEATRRLAAQDPPGSLTAFVVAAVARAAAGHRDVHAYRDWRGRLVTHHHVDVATIVEVDAPDGPFPLVHTLRDADVRTVEDLGAELRRIKARPSPTGSGAADRWLPRLAKVPGFVRALYAVLGRSPRLRDRAGTVGVSAVGMFAGGGGHAIAPLTLMSLQVFVGGLSEQPLVVDGAVVPRQVLDLTVSIDHDVVDGAPATRFGATLRAELESAELIEPPA